MSKDIPVLVDDENAIANDEYKLIASIESNPRACKLIWILYLLDWR